ncbi:MAG: hypothetical protein ACRDRJ_47290 [Streptosporangiaceae bacterium]
MTSEPGLIGLLYGADWERLSLFAEISDGSSVLVAPGKRYWYRAPDYEAGCDGVRAWELSEDDDADGADDEVAWTGGPEPPLDRLLCPAWLLNGSRLEVRGRVRACGREAIDVVMTRRPGRSNEEEPERAEVLVDAELGILLRVAEPGADGESDVTELVSADFDPVIDPARFAPPPACQMGEVSSADGPGWWALKTAAGLAAGGLGAWIRYTSSSRAPHPPDGWTVVEAIPDADPAPELTPDGAPSGPAPSADLLALLHAGGRDRLAATEHQWLDLAAMASQVPAGARRAGFGGLGLLMDAVSDLPAASHLISAVRLAGPGRYQIDHAYQPRRGPVSLACDGQRLWQVYADKITTGPPKPVPRDVARLADPSWLLELRLAGGTRVTLDGRPGYRLSVATGPTGRGPLLFPAAVAVIDAELGIILRLTCYLGTKPVQRQELRDITTGDGDFRVDIPVGVPVTEEAADTRGRRASPPPSITSFAARQAAAHAATTARNLLSRFDPRPPADGQA